jgi:hypothetical protein
MKSVRSSFSNAQTHFDMLHSIRECFHEFFAPQIEHTSDGAMFMWCRTSPGGNEHLASLHRKTVSVDSTLTYHKCVHSFSVTLTLDVPGLPS